MGEKINTDMHTPDPIFWRDIFLRKGDPIDAIGSLPNAEQKRYVFRGLIEKFYENEFKRKTGTPFHKEFIATKIDIFVTYVESKIGNFQSVHAVSFADGILEITDKEGKTLYQTNAITLWNSILKGSPEIQKIEEQARKDAETLREAAMTESLFGGSVLVKYAVISGGVALWVNSGISLASSWIRWQANIYNNFQRISEIYYRTPEGTFDRIDLKNEATLKELGKTIEWTRPSLRARTLQITERLGYTFDPIKKTFVHIDRQAFTMASELIQKLSLQELRSRYGLVTATEKDLIETRKALQEAGRSIDWKYYSRQSLTGFLSGKIMHAIMWPVFFHAFTQRQTSANLAAWVADWWLFTLGMNAGNKIWKIWWIAWKILSPIALGWGFMLLGHLWFERLGGSQLKWEHFNGTDMYDYKRSIVFHGLNLWAPEGIDQINKSRESSINAAIPRWNWTEWLGKAGRKVPLTAGTWVTPEIAFIQSRVNLWVDPSDWMGWSINNRNKEQWNIEVSRYKWDLKKNIYLLIEQYQRDLPPFFTDDNDSPAQKLKLFEDILTTHTLSWTWSSFYQLERVQIALGVLSEVQKWRKERSTQNIANIVDNYVESMYLNDMTFSNEKFRQEWERVSLGVQTKELEEAIKNHEEKVYFKEIFGRMQRWERIFEEDTIDDNPFTDRAHRKLSQEHKLFLSILKNTTKILWWSEKKEIEIGKVFALLLDRMSDFAIRRDSMNRLSKIPWDENGWFWKESEYVKSKIK